MTDEDLLNVIKGKPVKSNLLCDLGLHKWTTWTEPVRPQPQMCATQWKHCRRCNIHMSNSLQ